MSTTKEGLERQSVRFGLFEKEWDELDKVADKKQWSRPTLIMNYIREGLAREGKK